jgi:P-type E1-E2 ATPase
MQLEHLVLDINGTLTDRGEPIVSAIRRVEHLGNHLSLHLVTADTFGSAPALAMTLHARYRQVMTGADKAEYVHELGAESCVAIGNGRNDAAMLKAAALGIAVIGPEGTHNEALAAADVIALSIDEALAFLTNPTTLAATLRR